jgi:hypothetical protein
MSPSSNIPRSFDILRQTHGVQAVPPTLNSLSITTDLGLQQQMVPLPRSISLGLASGMRDTFGALPSGS